MNMSVGSSSVKKGETLVDTAMTLNAMKPDILVVRHQAAGAAELLAQKVDCSVINAGDGAHEHPTQALLDALTIRRAKGRIAQLTVAICGDVLHSRVARSNIILLNALGARVRVIAPKTLLPPGIEKFGVEVFTRMEQGLKDVDIVMMLRLQRERMTGSFVPSIREYFRFFGLDRTRLEIARPDALVMHPGPMNRGVEISSEIADGPRSLIQEQVEMGVAVRMAVIEAIIDNYSGDKSNAAGGTIMSKSLLFTNARIVDPSQNMDETGSLLVEKGKIAACGADFSKIKFNKKVETIDCAGNCIFPGLVDGRVFIGEPGAEHRENHGIGQQSCSGWRRYFNGDDAGYRPGDRRCGTG